MELISQKQYEELKFSYYFSEMTTHRDEMIEKGYKIVNTYLDTDPEHKNYIKRVYVYRKELE
ncbi:hypothetical protein [Priestia megaterium]|uniref:hypothetical protein n=1 Tax=Priestia megaterium TaxID=1404 RepID=UPI002877A0A1|nr:hypothetical protein [Priestia megaterium]